MARALIAIVVLAACKQGPAPAERSGTRPPASEAEAGTHLPAPAGRPTEAARPAKPEPIASCVDDGDPFAQATLEQRVTYLASKELDGRAPASTGDTATREHITARFRCLGLLPGGKDGSYAQPFDAEGSATANLVGYLPGTDDQVGSEIVVVGAHHDHLGGGYLGANDNASGVAAVLAVAQAVAKHGAHRRTIAFVTFGGEEKGLLGSLYYVANPPAKLPLDRVVEMINLDMVGSYSSKKAVYAFGAHAKLPAAKLLGKLARGYPKTRVSIGGNSVRGDHYGFCQKRIPYVFFWTPDARCYHEKCDTADRLDYPHMADIVALAGDLVQGLADSETDLADARRRSGCGTR